MVMPIFRERLPACCGWLRFCYAFVKGSITSMGAVNGTFMKHTYVYGFEHKYIKFRLDV